MGILKFKLNKYKWTVGLKPHEWIKGRLASDGLCYGVCEYDTHQIWIREDCDRMQIVRTLRHELVHAVIFSYGFVYQAEEKFNSEAISEFVAMYSEKIERIVHDFEKCLRKA